MLSRRVVGVEAVKAYLPYKLSTIYLELIFPHWYNGQKYHWNRLLFDAATKKRTELMNL